MGVSFSKKQIEREPSKMTYWKKPTYSGASGLGGRKETEDSEDLKKQRGGMCTCICGREC